MRIGLISDTHNRMEEIAKCYLTGLDLDILIHAGDFTNDGELKEFHKFLSDLDYVKAKHIILVPGNHDLLFKKSQSFLEQLFRRNSKINLLINDMVTINGMNFYGSPFTHKYGRDYDAFTYEKDSIEEERNWDLIPDNTDFLITHGPPLGAMDLVYDYTSNTIINAGSFKLAVNVATKTNIKHHVFGHIHDFDKYGIKNHGIQKQGTITYYNASCVDLKIKSERINRPIIIEV